MDLLFDLPVSDAMEVKEERQISRDLGEEVDAFIQKLEVIDPLEIKKEAITEKTIRYVLEEDSEIDINEIEVSGATEVVAEEPSKVIKYSLSDFESMEPTIKNASTIPVNEMDVLGAKELEVQAEELQLELKTKEVTPIEEMEVVDSKEVSPLDLTISELQKRSNSRKEKMKKFNYKFMNNVNQNLEDIENQPAYKRMGIDLQESNSSDVSQSRTTLSMDENDEIQLRSNNSFLHDNVD
jgi:cell division protein FtsZ